MKSTAPTKQVILLAAAAGALLVAFVLFQQRTRTIEGTWIDLFEGSSFFENQSVDSACGPEFDDASHFAYYPKRGTTEHRFVEANRKTLAEGAAVFVSEHGVWPVAAYAVKFEGRYQVLGIGFGHLGGHSSEYVVERIISMKPVPLTECDTRPS